MEKRWFHLPILVLLVCFLSSWTNFSTSATRISISENAYSNIVVAISPDVSNSSAETIINNLKSMMGQASAVLYGATKKRSYIKDVRILIPESWGNIRADDSTWETYSTADIRVAPASSRFGDMPYTLQTGGCGQPGEYIHLTPDYLRTLGDESNAAVYGPPGKVFVQQWARLRYGVFDEYGEKGSANYPVFFKHPKTGAIVPNLCTNEPPIFKTIDANVNGPCKIDSKTGVYDSNCVYTLDQNFLPKSSLMSLPSPDSVVEFCTDDEELRHDFAAPSKQNAKCGTSSVWSIISKHLDFANNNNPPSDIADIQPNFQIVKTRAPRFVLVADTSGSMADFNRIERLYNSSFRWIEYGISEGSFLGLVEFNTFATIRSPLIQIKDESSRQSLISSLPTVAGGWTCIGCGIRTALEILKPEGPGGVILLLTDGGETTSPLISDVLPDVVNANVRVVSIAFGRDAEDKIEEVARVTDGKSYFIDDDTNDLALDNAFTGSMTYQPAVPFYQTEALLHMSLSQEVIGGILPGAFIVDQSVGRNLVFRVDYTDRSHLLDFQLTSPNGTVFTDLAFDDVAKVAVLRLELAEIGKWIYEFQVSPDLVSLSVRVTSQSRSSDTVPITTECFVPNESPVRILAKVMQGSDPVVQARVKAYVEDPSGSIHTIQLFDDGKQADTTADDGVYSRYFTATNSVGRYTVMCEVTDDGLAYVKNGFVPNSSKLTPGNPFTMKRETIQMTGPFTRMAVSGSFKVTQTAAQESRNYPPSRVDDLVVTGLETSKNRSVTIQFTAPGEDLDFGTATSYEIRYSLAFDDLRPANFGSTDDNSTLLLEENVLIGSLMPMEVGTVQNLTFIVDDDMNDPKTFFIALRAVDRDGLAGEASNIVTASFLPQTENSSSCVNTEVTVVIFTGVLLFCLSSFLF